MRSPVFAILLLVGCSTAGPVDETPPAPDGGASAQPDVDSGSAAADAGALDSSTNPPPDASTDAAVPDSGKPPVEPFTGCVGTGSPFTQFNAFWSAFDEQYALFDIRLPNADWNDLGRAACPSLRDNMSDGGT